MPNWFFTFVMTLADLINKFAEVSPIVRLLTIPEKFDYKALYRIGFIYLLLFLFINTSLIIGIFLMWLICVYTVFYLIPAVLFTPAYNESKLTLAKHIAVVIVLCFPVINVANIIDVYAYALYQKLFNKGNEDVQ